LPEKRYIALKPNPNALLSPAVGEKVSVEITMDITTATIRETIQRCDALQPEWVRIPDAMKFSGIGRSRLYELIEAGKIRSVCLRKREKLRGIRLVSIRSLRDFISSFDRDGREPPHEAT